MFKINHNALHYASSQIKKITLQASTILNAKVRLFARNKLLCGIELLFFQAGLTFSTVVLLKDFFLHPTLRFKDVVLSLIEKEVHLFYKPERQYEPAYFQIAETLNFEIKENIFNEVFGLETGYFGKDLLNFTFLLQTKPNITNELKGIVPQTAHNVQVNYENAYVHLARKNDVNNSICMQCLDYKNFILYTGYLFVQDFLFNPEESLLSFLEKSNKQIYAIETDNNNHGYFYLTNNSRFVGGNAGAGLSFIDLNTLSEDGWDTGVLFKDVYNDLVNLINDVLAKNNEDNASFEEFADDGSGAGSGDNSNPSGASDGSDVSGGSDSGSSSGSGANGGSASETALDDGGSSNPSDAGASSGNQGDSSGSVDTNNGEIANILKPEITKTIIKHNEKVNLKSSKKEDEGNGSNNDSTSGSNGGSSNSGSGSSSISTGSTNPSHPISNKSTKIQKNASLIYQSINLAIANKTKQEPEQKNKQTINAEEVSNSQKTNQISKDQEQLIKNTQTKPTTQTNSANTKALTSHLVNALKTNSEHFFNKKTNNQNTSASIQNFSLIEIALLEDTYNFLKQKDKTKLNASFLASFSYFLRRHMQKNKQLKNLILAGNGDKYINTNENTSITSNNNNNTTINASTSNTNSSNNNKKTTNFFLNDSSQKLENKNGPGPAFVSVNNSFPSSTNFKQSSTSSTALFPLIQILQTVQDDLLNNHLSNAQKESLTSLLGAFLKKICEPSNITKNKLLKQWQNITALKNNANWDNLLKIVQNQTMEENESAQNENSDNKQNWNQTDEEQATHNNSSIAQEQKEENKQEDEQSEDDDFFEEDVLFAKKQFKKLQKLFKLNRK